MTTRRASSRVLALVGLLLAAAADAAPVTVPGTRVRLELPEGFTLAREFPGIGLDEDTTSVLVTELAVPVDAARETLSPDALEARGVRLHKSALVRVSGRDGLLVHASQRVGTVAYRKWFLLLGDGSGSVLVTATTPRALEAKHQAALVAVLKSVEWRPAESLAGRSELPFVVDEPAPLRVVTTAANAVVLADPTRATPADRVAPLVSVGASLSRVDLSDLPGFARQRLDETPTLEEISPTDARARELAELPGHEIRATANDRPDRARGRGHPAARGLGLALPARPGHLPSPRTRRSCAAPTTPSSRASGSGEPRRAHHGGGGLGRRDPRPLSRLGSRTAASRPTRSRRRRSSSCSPIATWRSRPRPARGSRWWRWRCTSARSAAGSAPSTRRRWKALVSEKFFALCEELGPERVGMLTGDASINPAAPVICCTTEVLASMALRGGEATDAPAVVLDEFHYYDDRERGMAWQLPLLILRHAQFPAHVRHDGKHRRHRASAGRPQRSRPSPTCIPTCARSPSTTSTARRPCTRPWKTWCAATSRRSTS